MKNIKSVVTTRKHVHWLIVIIFSGYCCAAQEMEYFTKSGKKTTKELSYVYKVWGYDDAQRERITTYLFTNDNAIESQHIVSDSSETLVVNFENGKMKEVRQYKADLNAYRKLSFYPNGNYQRIDILPQAWKNSFFNSLIWTYWDSTGRQTIAEGNGRCKCYYLTADSATMKYREEGELVEGYREGEWLTYRNDTLEYRELFVKGIFQHGTRYDADKEVNYDKTTIETVAEFPGGHAKLSAYIKKQLSNSVNVRKNDISGKVFVSFSVDTDGSVTDIKVIKGLSELTDKEAVSVVSKMPKWNPAMQRGKRVRVSFTLPIAF